MLTLRLIRSFLRHPILWSMGRKAVGILFRSEKEASPMKNKIRGGAFRLTGLILGIIGAVVAVTSIIFSAVGLHQAHLCKHCEKGAAYK